AVAADHRAQGSGRRRGRTEAPRHGREANPAAGRRSGAADEMTDVATASTPPAVKPAGAFSSWEIGLALRYLRAKRKEGGVALIAIISFVGIMLAVAVLISVMS